MAYYNRGLAYKTMGEKEKAYADFKKACEGGIKDACSAYKELIYEQ